MAEKQIYKACNLFDQFPIGYTVEQYYKSDRNPYQHMPADDDTPIGTDALVEAFAELQELDMNDRVTALVARRHCAFFIRIIRFKFAPHTAEDWDNVLQELRETAHIPDETKNAYAQAYYEYMVAHPELGRWDYLDQSVGGGAQSAFLLLYQTIGIRPQLLAALADK